MFKPFLISAAFATALAACGPSVEYSADGPTVSASDFAVITGDDWVGTLTYTDYSSGDQVTIKTAASVDAPTEKGLSYKISYPDEPWEDSKEKLTISKDGRLLDGHIVTSYETMEEGRVMITTSHLGEDDNKPAQIRLSYDLAPKAFSIAKDVKFEGADYIRRNTYEFTR